jgi:DNA mismatch repair protein MSH4
MAWLGLAWLGWAWLAYTAHQLHLKQTLETLPLLHAALQGCSNALLVALCDNLASAELLAMHQAIDRVINHDAATSKSAQQMRMQQCFSVQPGINGLLDVARKAYTETIEDIHALFEADKQVFGAEALKLHYTAKRGYHYTMPCVVGATLHRSVIQVARHGKSWAFSTTKLTALNTRQTEALNEILLLTARYG